MAQHFIGSDPCYAIRLAIYTVADLTLHLALDTLRLEYVVRHRTVRYLRYIYCVPLSCLKMLDSNLGHTTGLFADGRSCIQ